MINFDNIPNLTRSEKQGMKLEFAVSRALHNLGLKHISHPWDSRYAGQPNHGPDIVGKNFVIECSNLSETYRTRELSEGWLGTRIWNHFPHHTEHKIWVVTHLKLSKRNWYSTAILRGIRIIRLDFTIRTYQGPDNDLNKAIHILCRKLAYLKKWTNSTFCIR